MIEKNGTVYRDGTLTVVEFPSQDFLADLYLRAKAEGLLAYFFHEHDAPMSLYDFLNWCMDAGSVMYGAFRKRNAGMECIGLGKLGVLKPIGAGLFTAEVTMMFLREFQDRRLTLPSCRLMLELIFDHSKVSTVYGSIAEPNRASLRFMKAIGFQHLPQPVPYYTTWKGKRCGMYVSWLTREMWTAQHSDSTR